MSDRFRRLVLVGCLAVVGWAGAAHATDVGFSAEAPATTDEQTCLAPASLDETTLELFVTAVADLHKTATNLRTRLTQLEEHLQDLRTKNRALEAENARLRKTLRLQAAVPPKTWQSYPLDQEVRDANELLEHLVTTLTGLAPAE